MIFLLFAANGMVLTLEFFFILVVIYMINYQSAVSEWFLEQSPIWWQEVLDFLGEIWEFILWTQNIDIADDPNFEESENKKEIGSNFHWRKPDEPYWIF